MALKHYIYWIKWFLKSNQVPREKGLSASIFYFFLIFMRNIISIEILIILIKEMEYIAFIHITVYRIQLFFVWNFFENMQKKMGQNFKAHFLSLTFSHLGPFRVAATIWWTEKDLRDF